MYLSFAMALSKWQETQKQAWMSQETKKVKLCAHFHIAALCWRRHLSEANRSSA